MPGRVNQQTNEIRNSNCMYELKCYVLNIVVLLAARIEL
jgi:hypothetical protein